MVVLRKRLRTRLQSIRGLCILLLLWLSVPASANEPQTSELLDRVRAAHATPSAFTINTETPATFESSIPDDIAPTIKALETSLLRTDEHGRRAYVLSQTRLSFDGLTTTREERLNLLAGGPIDRRTDVELLSPTLRASAPLAPTRRATVSLYPPQTAVEQAATRKLRREPHARAIAPRSPIHLAIYVRDTLLVAPDIVVAATPSDRTTSSTSTITSAALGVEVTVENATGQITGAFFEDGDGSLLILPVGTLPGITFPAPHPTHWRVWSGSNAKDRAAKGEPFDAHTIFSAVAIAPKPETAAATRFDWKHLAATATVSDGPGDPVRWRSGDPWPLTPPATPR